MLTEAALGARNRGQKLGHPRVGVRASTDPRVSVGSFQGDVQAREPRDEREERQWKELFCS